MRSRIGVVVSLLLASQLVGALSRTRPAGSATPIVLAGAILTASTPIKRLVSA